MTSIRHAARDSSVTPRAQPIRVTARVNGLAQASAAPFRLRATRNNERKSMTKPSFGKAIAAILWVILAGASGARAQGSPDVPVPVITSISPVSALPGGAQFTLSVNGANFSSSQVLGNGNALTTTIVSTDQLTATISARLIATAEKPSLPALTTRENVL